MDEGRGRHRNRRPRRAWRSGRQDGGWARLDAGVDEVLDLIDVGLGGGVERYGVAVGHFLGKVVENGVDLGEMGVDLGRAKWARGLFAAWDWKFGTMNDFLLEAIPSW